MADFAPAQAHDLLTAHFCEQEHCNGCAVVNGFFFKQFQHGLGFFKGQHNLLRTVQFRQSNTGGRVIRQVFSLDCRGKHRENQPHIMPNRGVHTHFAFVNVKHILQRYLHCVRNSGGGCLGELFPHGGPVNGFLTQARGLLQCNIYRERPNFERSVVRNVPSLDQITIKAPSQGLHAAKRKARQPHFIAYCRAFLECTIGDSNPGPTD